MTKYKMLGDIEQGIHYTTFQEDVEEDQNKKEIGKSNGEKDSTDDVGQAIKQ